MPDKLFLSFWKLSLENLSIGRFIHRTLCLTEVKPLIDQARRNNTLICVSSDDLLAPYNQRELENYRKLCQVLQAEFGIQISVRDFCSSSLFDGEELFTITPLEVVQIGGGARLIIVTCSYSLPESRSPGRPDFQIAPDSVEFHLIEACQE